MRLSAGILGSFVARCSICANDGLAGLSLGKIAFRYNVRGPESSIDVSLEISLAEPRRQEGRRTRRRRTAVFALSLLYI
jgi:hypothetical protein